MVICDAKSISEYLDMVRDGSGDATLDEPMYKAKTEEAKVMGRILLTSQNPSDHDRALRNCENDMGLGRGCEPVECEYYWAWEGCGSAGLSVTDRIQSDVGPGGPTTSFRIKFHCSS
jgi:hypothetical protein